MRSRRQMLAPQLFTPPPADESTLTDRQAFALHELRQHPEGMTGEQVGRLVHDYFVASHSDSCVWCGMAGLALLKSLKAYGLVTLRKGGIWQAVSGHVQPEPDPDDPQNQPWPEGF